MWRPLEWMPAVNKCRQLVKALIVLALVAAAIAACDADTSFYVGIRNDTASLVRLQRCKDEACQRLFADEVQRVGPGTVVQVVASDSGLALSYKITRDGQSVGCLTLKFHRVHRALVVPVSSAPACPVASRARGT